jgi:hypothetical protein
MRRLGIAQASFTMRSRDTFGGNHSRSLLLGRRVLAPVALTSNSVGAIGRIVVFNDIFLVNLFELGGFLDVLNSSNLLSYINDFLLKDIGDLGFSLPICRCFLNNFLPYLNPLWRLVFELQLVRSADVIVVKSILNAPESQRSRRDLLFFYSVL